MAGHQNRVPLAGQTLVVGPSNSGKTRLTAATLDRWLREHGTGGVVVLEFAPVVERDDVVLGGRLTQFTTVPDGVWHGILDAHAPRADSDSAAAALRLAEENAVNAGRILDVAPADPRAVFVNDATITMQAGDDVATRLLDYCGRAEFAVLNAFESDELGVDDAVSRQEQASLAALRLWADCVVERT
ncbi:hypothetical protein [Haloarchaeobius sp. DFWS5]|uniref:hypothetical protein n=1 Tax=Haloarchaeobius sp. DFWS5 TaxID=3446114 RepID=UPI003EC00B6C